MKTGPKVVKQTRLKTWTVKKSVKNFFGENLSDKTIVKENLLEDQSMKIPNWSLLVVLGHSFPYPTP